MQGRLWYRGVLVMLFVGWFGVSAVYAGIEPGAFAQVYYGYYSAVNVLDEQIDSPTFKLDDEDMTVYVTDIEELYGAAVRLEGYEIDETTATVTLDGGSNITLTSAEAYELSGISAEDFLAAYVSLLDGSSVNITLQGSDDEEYWASGIGLYDIALLDTAEVSLAGGSAVDVNVSVDSDDAYAEAVGIEIENSAHAVVDISGASSVTATATIEGVDEIDGYTGATATGLLLEDGDHLEANLDGASSITATATAAGGYATATGAGINYAFGPSTALLTLENSSTIAATATGQYAMSTGAGLVDSVSAIANVLSGSSFSATATAEGDEDAYAESTGLRLESYYDSDGDGDSKIEVNIKGASSVTATASACAEGDSFDSVGAEASAVGVYAGYADLVEVTITDADISSTMSATATQDAAAEG